MTAAPLHVLPEGEVVSGIQAIGLALIEERTRADQLAAALVSNRRIGVAVGLVMAELGCSDAESLAALRRRSMDSNRRLADVAEDVIGLRRLATPARLDRGAASRRRAPYRSSGGP
jgi:hypothetical protein